MERSQDAYRTMKRQDFGLARFLTFSCEQRLPLFGAAALRDYFRSKLSESQQQHDFKLLAWVLMPEHVHLLIVPGNTPVTRLLSSLKTKVGMGIVARWKELDAPILHKLRRPDGTARFWQTGGGFDRNVRDRGELIETIRYIHNNPVRRGLVLRPIDWEWSSAATYHQRDPRPPIVDLSPQSELLEDVCRIETRKWGYKPVELAE
jgi:putative transposase